MNDERLKINLELFFFVSTIDCINFTPICGIVPFLTPNFCTFHPSHFFLYNTRDIQHVSICITLHVIRKIYTNDHCKHKSTKRDRSILIKSHFNIIQTFILNFNAVTKESRVFHMTKTDVLSVMGV